MKINHTLNKHAGLFHRRLINRWAGFYSIYSLSLYIKIRILLMRFGLNGQSNAYWEP